jgi:hypothetical protein
MHRDEALGAIASRAFEVVRSIFFDAASTAWTVFRSSMENSLE